MNSLRFDPIVDDPTDVGLVVEDVLDGHPGEGFPSTSQNLLDSIRAVGLLLAHSASELIAQLSQGRTPCQPSQRLLC